MSGNRNHQRTLGAFFLVVITTFLLLGAYFPSTEYTQKSHQRAKAFVCVHPGISTSLGATTEKFSGAPSFIPVLQVEALWQFAEQTCTTLLLSNSALQVAAGIYNTFYHLATIHAP